MTLPSSARSSRRWVIRAGIAAGTATILAATMQQVSAASARTGPGPASRSLLARMYSPADPYSPAYHHPYRHGVVPTKARLAKMRAWAVAHPHAAPALSASDLSFGGGVDGIGVTNGPEKVYLVFWGTQWGSQGTNSQGDITLSGDPNGAAPYLQQLFKGLGTGSETWSGVMTQYCQGVAKGTQTCPSGNTQHVGYPTGGALAGVWVDESAAAPGAATQAQIGQEAVNAAGHFGNTAASSNRFAQYDILSPTGANPDNYLTGGFCAWHDWNGDLGVSSPYGDIALTNMPYVTDVGTSCGENFINGGSAGILDGFSIVNGHEYAETITDQNPAGGWTNSAGSENGDLCAWNQGPGAPAQNLSLTTGTFAMQSTWGNDGAGGGDCEFTHAIVGNGGGGNTVTVTNPGSQTGTVGTAVSLQIHASDSASGQTLTYSATGLPAGLSISSSSGLITGTPTTAGTSSVTVTAKDTTNASGSATFSWTINSAGGTNTIINGGFETGTFSGWTTSGAATAIVSSGQHSGSHAARAGSTSPTSGNSNIAQTFTASGGTTLTFWYNVTCPDTVTYDWATATLRDRTAGTTKTILARTCVASSGWKQVNATLVAGHSYTLTLTSHDDNYPGDPTYTLFDDVSTH
jgi:serine protease